MTQEQITGNRLIAEFMGFHFKDGKIFAAPPEEAKLYREAQYHSSWDWLMPVVEKIHKMNKMVNINFYTEGGVIVECLIYNWELGSPRQEHESNSAIESVYNCVIDFITWYNQQNTEKAKKLVDRFERALGPNTGIIAAEIAVDEVREALAHWSASVEPYKFWDSVKDEIEKL